MKIHRYIGRGGEGLGHKLQAKSYTIYGEVKAAAVASHVTAKECFSGAKHDCVM